MQVLHCVPSEEEAALLSPYARTWASRDALSDAELFCLDLMRVPRYKSIGIQTSQSINTIRDQKPNDTEHGLSSVGFQAIHAISGMVLEFHVRRPSKATG